MKKSSYDPLFKPFFVFLAVVVGLILGVKLFRTDSEYTGKTITGPGHSLKPVSSIKPEFRPQVEKLVRAVQNIPPQIRNVRDLRAKTGELQKQLDRIREWDASTIPQLLELAQRHPQPFMRQTAIHILGGIRDPQAPQALLRLWKDSRDLQIKHSALAELARGDDLSIAPLLAQVFQYDSNASARVIAAKGLVRRGQIDILTNALAVEPDKYVRYRLIQILGEAKGQHAVEILKTLVLQETDSQAQIYAIAGLIKIGGDKTGQALREIRESGAGERVRKYAEDSLKRLNVESGKNGSSRQEDWLSAMTWLLPSVQVRYDAHTLESTVFTGGTPHFVGITPDSRKAYAPNFFGTTVFVVNLDDRAVEAEVNIGATGFHETFTPDSRFAYIATVPSFEDRESPSPSAKVVVIETEGNTVIKNILLPEGIVDTGGIDASPDGSRVYLAINKGRFFDLTVQGFVVVIDTGSNEVIAEVPTPSFASHLRVSRDGSQVFVTLPRTSEIGIINTATLAVEDSIRLPVAEAEELVLNPDGSKIYTTVQPTAELLEVDVARKKVTNRHTPQPHLSFGLGISPDGRFVYEGFNGGCFPEDSFFGVRVIDTRNFHVVAGIPMDTPTGFFFGGGPGGLDVSKDGRHAVVSSIFQGAVNIISVAPHDEVVPVAPPVIESIVPEAVFVDELKPITLRGKNFSPVAEENKITFGQFTLTPDSATSTVLTFTPPFPPEFFQPRQGKIEVRVSIQSVTSNTVFHSMVERTPIGHLAVAESDLKELLVQGGLSQQQKGRIEELVLKIALLREQTGQGQFGLKVFQIMENRATEILAELATVKGVDLSGVSALLNGFLGQLAQIPQIKEVTVTPDPKHFVLPVGNRQIFTLRFIGKNGQDIPLSAFPEFARPRICDVAFPKGLAVLCSISTVPPDGGGEFSTQQIEPGEEFTSFCLECTGEGRTPVVVHYVLGQFRLFGGPELLDPTRRSRTTSVFHIPMSTDFSIKQSIKPKILFIDLDGRQIDLLPLTSADKLGMIKRFRTQVIPTTPTTVSYGLSDDATFPPFITTDEPPSDKVESGRVAIENIVAPENMPLLADFNPYGTLDISREEQFKVRIIDPLEESDFFTTEVHGTDLSGRKITPRAVQFVRISGNMFESIKAMLVVDRKEGALTTDLVDFFTQFEMFEVESGSAISVLTVRRAGTTEDIPPRAIEIAYMDATGLEVMFMDRRFFMPRYRLKMNAIHPELRMGRGIAQHFRWTIQTGGRNVGTFYLVNAQNRDGFTSIASADVASDTQTIFWESPVPEDIPEGGIDYTLTCVVSFNRGPDLTITRTISNRRFSAAGTRGDDVRQLFQKLIDIGYLNRGALRDLTDEVRETYLSGEQNAFFTTQLGNPFSRTMEEVRNFQKGVLARPYSDSNTARVAADTYRAVWEQNDLIRTARTAFPNQVDQTSANFSGWVATAANDLQSLPILPSPTGTGTVSYRTILEAIIAQESQQVHQDANANVTISQSTSGRRENPDFHFYTVGAIGFMQVMPFNTGTGAAAAGLSIYRPDQNILAGVRIMNSMIGQVQTAGNDTDRDLLMKALAAYNGGPRPALRNNSWEDIVRNNRISVQSRNYAVQILDRLGFTRRDYESGIPRR